MVFNLSQRVSKPPQDSKTFLIILTDLDSLDSSTDFKLFQLPYQVFRDP